MLTPAQLRAARALVNWSRERLAKASDTGTETIKNFEIRGSDPKQGTILKWMGALRSAGVVFQDPDDEYGSGVRLRLDAGKGKTKPRKA